MIGSQGLGRRPQVAWIDPAVPEIRAADDGEPLTAGISQWVQYAAPPEPEPTPEPPFSVSWNPPASHDGTAFTFRLSFSERPEGFSFRYLKFTAITAENGKVLKTKRVRNLGARHQHWDITVNPLSNHPVRLDFYGPDLKAYDDSQKLASGISQWVQGPK